MAKVVVEKRGKLVTWDWINGAIFAVVIPVLLKAAEMISAEGTFNIDWDALLPLAATLFVGYLGFKAGSADKVTVVPGENESVEASADTIRRVLPNRVK